jgi:hypothetical protein
MACAPAGAVTLAELQGSLIDISVTSSQARERDGQPISFRVTTYWRISINGSSFRSDVFDVVTGPNGTGTTPHRVGTMTLERPQELRTWGGGEANWAIKDGILEWIRTYQQGASRLVIQFQHNRDGMACTARYTFARENGVGTIELKDLRGFPQKILMQTFISSTCRITRIY